MNINERRVVVTGLGVVTPNAHGIEEFETNLRNGISGIRYIEKLKELNFRCQVGGVPQNIESKVQNYFSEEDLFAMNEAMIYSAMAATDAWKDAGLEVTPQQSDSINWDSGCIVGSGLTGMDTIGKILVPQIDAGKVRRMGSTMVEQTMASAISAKLSGLLALGNQVSSNSSACSTGTEAINDCYWRIKYGLAEKMLGGGAETSSPYVWGGFDAMRVLNDSMNECPEKASRPMSQSAGGFIPGSGSGILLLESLESAKNRGARIYAEILSAYVNCGGHRNGGSMTAPNCDSVQRCIRTAINMAGIKPAEVDYINGHLTATMADPIEINNWQQALECSPANPAGNKLPLVNSTKSLIGHCLGAAGSIEAAAVVLQLYNGFVHGSLNCDDLHEKIKPHAESVVHQTISADCRIAAKASFGFGDVNSCLIIKKWEE